ncbi:MAG: STAS domain-containing protein [Candidatus Hydrogenedentes bacterium]|nr:STAS domain-containing protein [Candidatus Hydrogenedentota bacterium]
MVEFTEEPGKLVCTFNGRLDTVSCMGFQDLVCNRIEGSVLAIVFDLQGVDYVSSMFLRLCVLAGKAVGSGRFSIVHVNPPVKKVFKIAGFDQYMSIE